MSDQNTPLFESTIARNKRRLFWYLLLVLVLFGVILFYYFQNVALQQNNIAINAENELYVEELSLLKNRSDARIDSLTEVIKGYEKSMDSLVVASNQNAVEPPVMTPPKLQERKEILNEELEQLKNSKYIVTNHSYNFPLDKRRKIGSFLKAKGYSKFDGYTYDDEDQKPSWMSYKSTVLYYSSQSKEKATALAKELTALTGYRFGVARGGGLGVIKGQEDVTFFIHSVGSIK